MLAAGLLARKAVERGLTRPAGGEDLARAGLARGHRVPRQDRPADRISTSSASTSSATAARPASATPARSTRPSRRPSSKNDLVAASVLSRQPQLRGARPPERQGELPDVARRWWSPSRSPAGSTSTCRRSRSARDATARTSSCATLADAARRCATRCTPPLDPETFRSALRRLRGTEPALERRSRATTGVRLRSGTARRPTSRSRRSSTTSASSRARIADITRRASAGDLRRLGHDRPHQPRRRDQEDLAGRRLPAGERRRGRGLQQLRLAPRQRPGDDARHLRQRAHQEPDGARRRGRRHGAPARPASR